MPHPARSVGQTDQALHHTATGSGLQDARQAVGVIHVPLSDVARHLDHVRSDVEIRVVREVILRVQPAVGLGYATPSSFTRCRVLTRNKQAKLGYIGAAQIYEDVTVDVNRAKDGPALILRAARNASTARTNGHVLRNVTANGPVDFINDANSHNELFRRTLQRAGKPLDVNWDTNPAAHESAPANGWGHPFVFYRCRLGDREHKYSLLNVKTNSRKVLEEVDLSPLADKP
jgi:hypothetical protein